MNVKELERGAGLAPKENPKSEQPPLWSVYIKQNKTPMLLLDGSLQGGSIHTPEPVIEAIGRFFSKDVEEAERHIKEALDTGKSVLAELFFEIAETRVKQATDYVRERVSPSVAKIITFHLKR